MKIEVEKIQVQSLGAEGLSYKDIDKITSFSKDCVMGICQMRKVLIKKKTGPKPKINSVPELRLKGEYPLSRHVVKSKFSKIDSVMRH